MCVYLVFKIICYYNVTYVSSKTVAVAFKLLGTKTMMSVIDVNLTTGIKEASSGIVKSRIIV